MKTGSKICPECIVDVCLELFNKIKHFEKSASEIISTYFGKDVIEKIFDCFKNWLEYEKLVLIFGGERRDKISALTKEQKEIIEKLGFADALF